MKRNPWARVFIISPDGYILTNNHVIADADEILVRLADRSELKAKLIGTDPRSDVALLKIEGKDLPVLKLGKSQDLKAGQWVVAIGSPFGFDHTVTQGIVSAIGRSLPNENYVPFIQTDVPINPGNSGGPLFNLAGEVVGINSQIYTRSGGFMGVSFAIPIDVAMDVSNQLKSGGKVSRGWLGVVIQEVNKDLAESFGLEKPAGALVAQIQDDGPAAKGGLQVGDVILSMNGQPIVMSADLPHLVGALKAGSKADLEVIREGKRKNVELTVGAIPEEGKELEALPKSSVERSSNRLGVSVAELTEEQKKNPRPQGWCGYQGSPGRSCCPDWLAAGRCDHSPEQPGDRLLQGVHGHCQGTAEEPLGVDAGSASRSRQLHHLQTG